MTEKTVENSLTSERARASAGPEVELFKLYVLHNKKFHQAVLDEYCIFYSRTLKHFVTFRRAIAWAYPKAVLRVVEFGDFLFDPRLPKFKNG